MFNRDKRTNASVMDTVPYVSTRLTRIKLGQHHYFNIYNVMVSLGWFFIRVNVI